MKNIYFKILTLTICATSISIHAMQTPLESFIGHKVGKYIKGREQLVTFENNPKKCATLHQLAISNALEKKYPAAKAANIELYAQIERLRGYEAESARIDQKSLKEICLNLEKVHVSKTPENRFGVKRTADESNEGDDSENRPPKKFPRHKRGHKLNCGLF